VRIGVEAPVTESMRDKINTVIIEVLGPMVAADGGRLYVVEADARRVTLHLAGRFAGCPGNQIATRRVIQPAIAAVAPDAEVTVTWGRLVPDGATPVEAPAHGF
jgi:Fe-S cluster biogenesis protein NfuA